MQPFKLNELWQGKIKEIIMVYITIRKKNYIQYNLIHIKMCYEVIFCFYIFLSKIVFKVYNIIWYSEMISTVKLINISCSYLIMWWEHLKSNLLAYF